MNRGGVNQKQFPNDTALERRYWHLLPVADI